MTITLNGKAHTVTDESPTVAEFVASLNLGPAPVLVELNGEAIFAREYRDHCIRDGDTVEVVRMVAGG